MQNHMSESNVKKKSWLVYMPSLCLRRKPPINVYTQRDEEPVPACLPRT